MDKRYSPYETNLPPILCITSEGLDGTEIKIYIDGVLTEYCSRITPYLTQRKPIIGSMNPASYSFMAKLTISRIYNYALLKPSQKIMNGSSALNLATIKLNKYHTNSNLHRHN